GGLGLPVLIGGFLAGKGSLVTATIAPAAAFSTAALLAFRRFLAAFGLGSGRLVVAAGFRIGLGGRRAALDIRRGGLGMAPFVGLPVAAAAPFAPPPLLAVTAVLIAFSVMVVPGFLSRRLGLGVLVHFQIGRIHRH